MKGSSVQRAQVAECMAHIVCAATLPRRPGTGVTFEIAGDKARDGITPANTPWGALLKEIEPDPSWEALLGPRKSLDHMQAHRRAKCCAQAGCCLCCLVLVAAIVVGSFAATGAFA